jgi:hypothetical protein
MNIFTRYKNILIAFFLIGAGFVAYSIFFTGKSVAPLTSQTVDPAQTAVEQELLTLLVELRSIRLDLAIFDDVRFQSLKDFSRELVPEPVGRPNPFSPL